MGTELSCYGNQLTWGFECADNVLTKRVRIAHFFGLSLDVHMEVLFLRVGKVLRHVLNIHVLDIHGQRNGSVSGMYA